METLYILVLHIERRDYQIICPTTDLHLHPPHFTLPVHVLWTAREASERYFLQFKK